LNFTNIHGAISRPLVVFAAGWRDRRWLRTTLIGLVNTGLGQVRTGCLQGEIIALAAETADYALRDVGKVGMVPEWLPRMYVGQVDFDKGNGNRQQGIAQGNRGVGEGCRIDDDESDLLLAGQMNPVDQFVFGIALQRE